MSDNTTFQSSLTATPPKGLVVGGDDIAGVLYQRMKLIYGDDGTNAGDVSIANPFPIREKKVPYMLLFYDGANIKYSCKHTSHGTATSATDWEITRMLWGSYGPTDIQTLTGSVDGRDGLGWV